jgi:hypothetical protein
MPDLLKNPFLNFRRIFNTDPFRAQCCRRADAKLTAFMELASAIQKISGPDLPAPVGVN